jgi:hypothetical protein
MRVYKWTLFSLLGLAMASAPLSVAQSDGVVIEKLPLDKNPDVSRRCRSPWASVDWVDNSAVLVAYRIPPCSRKSYPILFGYSVLNMQGTVIASTVRDNETSYLKAGPNGGVLAITREHSVQVLDRHFIVLKTIDCETANCNVFLSEDRTGFALCGVPAKDDCQYFRGRVPEVAKLEDFPGGFPELEMEKKRAAPASSSNQPRHYAVSKDESWFFDRKGNVFRIKTGGQAEKLQSPTATLLDSSCRARVSEEGHSRLLTHCEDELSLGVEMPIYYHERIVLYDVPSGKVLLTLDPGAGNSEEKLSPDGKRIAVVRGGVPGGRSSATLYYVP